MAQWQFRKSRLGSGNTSMSGGQNYLLPAMDMAKVGPLSVVNAYAQI